MRSQQASIDELIKKPTDTLFKYFDNTNVFEEKELITDAIIKRSKLIKDTTYLTSGYLYKLLYLYKDERILTYCDSIIELRKNNANKYFPAGVYMDKGRYYHRAKKYKKAFNQYMLALEYAKKYHNEKYIQYCHYFLGVIKFRLGDTKESLSLQLKNFNYIKKKKDSVSKRFLMSLHGLTMVYNELQQLDSARYYSNYGMERSIVLKNTYYQSLFKLNIGTYEFNKQNYERSFQMITDNLDSLIVMDNKSHLCLSYLYLGFIKEKLGNKEQAIEYFKKVDTLYRQYKDPFPKFRMAYTSLVAYYKEKKDLPQQAVYLDRLIRMDSVLHDNAIYLNKEIIHQYDIPKLVSEHDQLIGQIQEEENQKQWIIVGLLLVLLLVVGGFYYQYRKQRVYKARFDRILQDQKSLEPITNVDVSATTTASLPNKTAKSLPTDSIPKDPIVSPPTTSVTTRKKIAKPLEVPEEIVQKILNGLADFEQGDLFLDSDITQAILAKNLGTNTKYLSKVVRQHKAETFNYYINGLRIQHIIQKLKRDKDYRKYTLLAIANEAGFRKIESFSKAFAKETGITPTYFIKALNKA